jgi:S1-C subfamily serine protease
LNIKPVRLGDSKPANDGTAVLAVGFGGTENAVSLRVVSRRDFSGYWEYLLENAIFTAPAFPSFGGAALFDDQGRLIGIGSLIIPSAGSADSHSPGNMFVPINALKPIMADLLDQGRSERRRNPWLDAYTAEQFGFLIVQRIADGGPSDIAGVEVGDIIVSVGGQAVTGQMDFYRKMWSLGGPGTAIALTVLKSGSVVKSVGVASTDRYRWLRLSKGN